MRSSSLLDFPLSFSSYLRRLVQSDAYLLSADKNIPPGKGAARRGEAWRTSLLRALGISNVSDRRPNDKFARNLFNILGEC